MCSKNQLFFCVSLLFCATLSAADRMNMQRNEQLPDHESLATHTAFLVPASLAMHTYGGDSKYGVYSNGNESGVVTRVMHYTLGTRKWNVTDEGYTFTLNKKVNDHGLLTYEDFPKRLTVNHGSISSIGATFAQSSFLQFLHSINLDHNNLNSFAEIQSSIFYQCPHLKIFSAKHNAFTGYLAVSHGALDMIDLSCNKFTSILDVVLPDKATINLCNNQIKTIKQVFPQPFGAKQCVLYLKGNPILGSKQN